MGSGGSFYFWLGASADADPALVASDQAASRLDPLGFDPLRVVELDKLCKSQSGLTAAYKYALGLQEKGWMRFPAPEWNQPAILAFAGPECVAGINYQIDEDQLKAHVEFAFCAPSHPIALTKILLRFRSALKKTPATEICFTCHAGNAQMMKAVRAFKLEPSTHSFRLQLAGAE